MRVPAHVAILGLGVMGGSLARALKALAAPPRVVGWSQSDADVHAALAAGAVDAVEEDVPGAVAGAELVVLATPVGAMVELLGRHAGTLADAPVLTDMASVKAPVMAAAADAALGPRFVGSHPLAGSHRSGFAASRGDLFRDAPVFVVPGSAEARAVATVEGMWRAVGGRPERLEGGAHDALLAWTSHLPQASAFALGAALAGGGADPGRLGPGGLDATRLSASAPALWTDILLHNAGALAGPLRALRLATERLETAVARGDAAALEALLAASARWRGGP